MRLCVCVLLLSGMGTRTAGLQPVRKAFNLARRGAAAAKRRPAGAWRRGAVQEKQPFGESSGSGGSPAEDATLNLDLPASMPLSASPNVPLATVKNLRDLASVEGSEIRPRRFFRMGYPSKATDDDMRVLREELGLKTLIDLRSDKELCMDDQVDCSPYYDHFQSLRRSRATTEWYNFCMETIPEPSNTHAQESLGKKAVKKAAKKVKSKVRGTYRKPVKVEDPTLGPAPGPQRLLISIMDEATYKKGVLVRLRKRHQALVTFMLIGGIFSKRLYEKARQLVLDYVNDGGLPLLNDLLLSYSGEELALILKVVSDRTRHPVGLYCTAGKDRTGLITMLILSALGVPDEALLNDYILSDTAYKDLNDNKAMVGALEQQNLDAETFLRAPREVMETTLAQVREQYGSVNNYLDAIGFDAAWRAKLKDALRGE